MTKVVVTDQFPTNPDPMYTVYMVFPVLEGHAEVALVYRQVPGILDKFRETRQHSDSIELYRDSLTKLRVPYKLRLLPA